MDSNNRPAWIGAAWALFAGAAMMLLTMSHARAANTTYSGRAYAAFVNTPVTGPLRFADTGSLSSTGGHRNAGLLKVTVTGLLSATVASASTTGGGGIAHSRASLADVVVTVGGNTISASFLQARSRATCSGVSGSSEIAELKVNDLDVSVTTEPNQRIDLPLGGTLVINEQNPYESGNYHEITVNAIHVVVPDVAEVILSSAHSDVRCHEITGKGPCHDFVTGGGWITAPSGGKGTFGLHAGFKAGSSTPVGHFLYIDHGTGMKVRSTSIGTYLGAGSDSDCRTFRGSCMIRGVSGKFTVTVCDHGEPGTNDTFKVVLSNGYTAEGALVGGNIQLHAPCIGRP